MDIPYRLKECDPQGTMLSSCFLHFSGSYIMDWTRAGRSGIMVHQLAKLRVLKSDFPLFIIFSTHEFMLVAFFFRKSAKISTYDNRTNKGSWWSLFIYLSKYNVRTLIHISFNKAVVLFKLLSNKLATNA